MLTIWATFFCHHVLVSNFGYKKNYIKSTTSNEPCILPSKFSRHSNAKHKHQIGKQKKSKKLCLIFHLVVEPPNTLNKIPLAKAQLWGRSCYSLCFSFVSARSPLLLLLLSFHFSSVIINKIGISALIPNPKFPLFKIHWHPFHFPQYNSPFCSFSWSFFKNWGWYSITQKEKRYEFVSKPQIYMDLVTSHHYPFDFCSGSVKVHFFCSFIWVWVMGMPWILSFLLVLGLFRKLGTELKLLSQVDVSKIWGGGVKWVYSFFICSLLSVGVVKISRMCVIFMLSKVHKLAWSALIYRICVVFMHRKVQN